MAKLKSSFTVKGNQKAPSLGTNDSSGLAQLKASSLSDSGQRLLNPVSSGSVAQGLNFGTLHTKASAVVGQTGSQWTSILSSATGGVTSVIGGGLFSSGAFGFIGKLFGLFGGSKSTPPVPTAFQSPLPQQNVLNVTPPGASSPLSLGEHPMNISASGSGAYQQTGSSVAGNYSNSGQVVQIVKQALLTSSSLNDVISEV